MSDEPGQHGDGSAARHERVKDIFAITLGLPEAERAAKLDTECGDDQALRAEIESLLAHATEASTLSVLEPPTAPRTDPLIGSTIGRYHIKTAIGSGGMGTVYQAMQEQPRRVVALKVMKRGIASKSALRRFEYESQILARLRHPGIAQIYEAGTHEDESGESVPFFAMEYIPAHMPITRYAEQKKLGTRERLDLFARVCDAVQHGHGKGIIHRDLKPSNILVDSSGQPKIIDFGVARSTDSDLAVTTLQTDIGQLIGTLQYMSPEQCLADPTDLDTRSDVYALGVVLYELLCGKPPYDISKAAVFEATRIIRESTPARPSTISKTLRGDVETVVMKALEKDRDRRYRSATELGEDLRHYLNNEPISAQPPSLSYQVQMFAKKNRTVFRAGAVVILTLVIGVLGTTTGMVYGWTQYNRAEASLVAERAALVTKAAALTATELEAERANAAALAEREARLTAQHQTYRANIETAEASMRVGEIARAQARLSDCPQSDRGWEWSHLLGLSDQSLSILRGHESYVVSASFSRDGSRVLTASDDKTARMWDAASGEEIAVLSGHTQGIVSASFSPNGSRVITASNDGTARLWDADSGNEIAVLRGHERSVNFASFSSDGSRVLTASDDMTARLWDANSGEEIAVLRGHKNWISSALFSPDGTRVVTVSDDNTSRIWDGTTGEAIDVFREHQEATQFFFKYTRPASFNPDGTRVLTVSRDMTARIWDPVSGETFFTLHGHTGRLTSARFNPQGTKILTSSMDGSARIWDADTGIQLAAFGGSEGAIWCADFCQQGDHVVATSFGSLRVWDTETFELLVSLRGHTGETLQATFRSDCTQLVTASSDGTSRIWQVGRGQGAAILGEPRSEYGLLVAQFSPDGTRVVMAICPGDDTARVRDAGTGQVLATLRGHADCINSALFSPDGSRVLTASDDTTARLWDANSGTEIATLHGHKSIVASASFSPDGSRVITASHDATARIWNANSGETIAVLRGHETALLSAVFSPDGSRVLTASSDTTARLWEAESGTEIAALPGHENSVNSASFSPDGSRVVTASNDETARIWSATTGEEIVVLRGHENIVNSASFSPDGSRVVTASRDRTARVWDAASGAEVAVLRGHAGVVESASFSPDGSRVVTASEDKTVRLWVPGMAQEVFVLRGQFRPVRWAVFSRDATRLLATSDWGSTQVWDSVPYRVRLMERMSQGPGGEAAASAVDSLRTSLGDWTRVANVIRQDTEITDEVRRRALGIITVRAEEERRARQQEPTR